MDRPQEPAINPDTSPGPRRLALVELVERDGRVGRAVDVHAWPLSLGRALSNDLVIDDPHVAAHHATLQLDAEGRLQVQLGDTLNGLVLDQRSLVAGQVATLSPGGGELHLGSLRVRVRLPGETLAAEKPLPRLRQATGLVAAGAAALLMLSVMAGHWITLDPGADTTAWLPLLLGLPVLVAGWAGLWALASKLFQHRFEFAGHLRIALPWLLGIELTDVMLPALAAALGWVALWRLEPALEALLALLLVRQHLLHLLPHSRRTISTVALAAAMAGVGVMATLNLRSTDRLTRPPYMSTLPLPMLRLDPPVAPAVLVQDLAPLAAQLAQRVDKARADEATDAGDTPAD